MQRNMEKFLLQLQFLLSHWLYFLTTTDIVKFMLYPLVLRQEGSDEPLFCFILRIKHLLPSPVPNLGRRDASSPMVREATSRCCPSKRSTDNSLSWPFPAVPRASNMLGKHSNTVLHPNTQSVFSYLMLPLTKQREKK